MAAQTNNGQKLSVHNEVKCWKKFIYSKSYSFLEFSQAKTLSSFIFKKTDLFFEMCKNQNKLFLAHCATY